MEPAVKEKFDAYPVKVRQKMRTVRTLIFDVAEQQNIGKVTETLKWGEPSYLTTKGSTLRIDWKQSAPDQFCLYFNCNTKLVDTFRELFADKFEFQGNRAIVLFNDMPLPEQELAECISMTLRYHQIKHLPLLGA